MGERGFGGLCAFGGGSASGGSGVSSSVVSFRQGSNVEFTNPALDAGVLMVPTSSSGDGGGGGATPSSSSQQTKSDSSDFDFTNPVYDAVNNPTPSSSSGGGGGGGAAAIIPTSVIQRSSPQIHIRQFDAVEEDSGKDTQNLILEAGSSE